MSYVPYILPSAEKDLNHLSKEIYERIKRSIVKLERDPRSHGSIKLSGTDGYRIRIGDWRVLYRIDDALRSIYIYRVKHRNRVYD